MTEETYHKLKEAVEDARSSAQQAKGALKQFEKQLSDQFNCANLEEARSKLKKMEGRLEQAEAEFKKEMAAYEKKWKDD